MKLCFGDCFYFFIFLSERKKKKSFNSSTMELTVMAEMDKKLLRGANSDVVILIPGKSEFTNCH